MTSSMAWLDGRLVPAETLVVSPLSATLQYGIGVFEGIRCRALTGGGASIFRLGDHMGRLLRSAAGAGIDLGAVSVKQLCDGAIDLANANHEYDIYIRPFVFMGVGKPGLSLTGAQAHVAIVTWRWDHYFGAGPASRGLRVRTVPAPQHRMHGTKASGLYVLAAHARLLATREGLDDVIYVRNEEFTEASAANVFVARDGALITPPANSGILPGFTRESIMTLARGAGISVEEGAVRRDDATYDEAFLTGTAAGIVPIQEIDGRRLRGSEGAVTKRLQSMYSDLVLGQLPGFEGWVTQWQP